MEVQKTVIPAAGSGTRMLPATKAIPKELVTVVDKPAIQHVVEEAVSSGSTSILVITGRGKGALEDHFDRAPELEAILEKTGKEVALAEVVSAADLARVHFIRQGTALGLGHAVGCARDFVGWEPFFVALPDDLLQGEVPALLQLKHAQLSVRETVLAVQPVPWESVSRYGVVKVDQDGLVEDIVEKPSREDAPSNLAVVGRYLLQPEVFDCLDEITPGAGGELQLTDAIALMIKKGLPVRACMLQGKRYDTGSPLGFIGANVGMALARPGLSKQVRELLQQLLAADETGRCW